MNRSWLRCSISKGMFSDERAVTYPPRNGLHSHSFFVPSDDVREQGGTAVRVEIFSGNGATFAVFPNDARTTVAIEPSDILS